MEATVEITATVKNVPAIRFPEFEGRWALKRFGTIVKRVSEPVKVKPDTLYQQIGIRSHGKGLFHKEFVDGKTLGNKRVFWVKEDALIVNIVFAWEQAVAKTTSGEIGMIASHRFPMYMPVNNQSDINYLLYFFLTKKGKFLLELASPGGAGRNKTLGQKEFENLKFAIPTLSEQKKIASFLTIVDYKVQQLRKKKELLEKYKKGVMQQIFSQQIRFKDDNGNEFPEWEEKKLVELCDVAKSGGTPTSTKKEYYDGDIPFLSISDMTAQGKYLEYTSNQISQLGLKNSSAWIIPVNTIIYSMYASVGFVSISKIPLATSQAVLNLIINKEYNTEFVYYSLVKIQESIAKFITTGTQGNLNAQTVKGFLLKMPSIEEQTKIVNFLSSIDNKLNYTSKQLKQAQQFKKGMLQQLFV
ncbi:restriction endonuclease subunit S [Pontibacter sp. BT731]|uniref:restriction endonuclease subunit S n=1 Tax=Pontibacter coccineus TaxID=3063328 RepID=UPI0026E2076C|nr:restriction endonuclease subunit S [Pontibacter sp. BT731]MDO6392074.1 restriction endonuclease subunit S [Pontibacter sp. BT731]